MKLTKHLIGALCAGLMTFGGVAMANTASSSSDSSNCPTTKGQGGSGSSMSQSENMPKSSQNLRTVTLTVKRADPKTHTVTFEAQVKPEANIVSNGKPIALDNLQEGDTIRASFDPQTGELVKAMVLKKGSDTGGSSGSSSGSSESSGSSSGSSNDSSTTGSGAGK